MECEVERETILVSGFACRRVDLPLVREIQRLRYQVWKAEGVTLYDEESGTIADPHDKHAMHWGAFNGDRLVGAARLCIHDWRADLPDAHLLSGLNLPDAGSKHESPCCSPKSSRSWNWWMLRSPSNRGRETSWREVHCDHSSRLRPPTISAARLGFTFDESTSGHAMWSPAVPVRAGCLILAKLKPHGLDNPDAQLLRLDIRCSEPNHM